MHSFNNIKRAHFKILEMSRIVVAKGHIIVSLPEYRIFF